MTTAGMNVNFDGSATEKAEFEKAFCNALRTATPSLGNAAIPDTLIPDSACKITAGPTAGTDGTFKKIDYKGIYIDTNRADTNTSSKTSPQRVVWNTHVFVSRSVLYRYKYP